MGTVFATVDDLAVRVPGGIPEDQADRAVAYLEDASDEIRDEIGRDYESDAVPGTVRKICLAVALRAWLNPTQLAATGLGEYTATHSSRGGIYLTEEEKSRLAKFRATGGLWVQPLDRSPDSTLYEGTRYIPSADGGTALPLGVE